MTAREQIVYHYLATHRGDFLTVRQVRDALGLTDSQARGALYALWRQQQVTSGARRDDMVNVRGDIMPYNRRGGAQTADRRTIGVVFGIEEEKNDAPIRRSPEAG